MIIGILISHVSNRNVHGNTNLNKQEYKNIVDMITLSFVEVAISFFSAWIQLVNNAVSPHKQRIAFSNSAILQSALSGKGEMTWMEGNTILSSASFKRLLRRKDDDYYLYWYSNVSISLYNKGSILRCKDKQARMYVMYPSALPLRGDSSIHKINNVGKRISRLRLRARSYSWRLSVVSPLFLYTY